MNNLVHIESLAVCNCGDEFYLHVYVASKPSKNKVVARQTHYHGNNVPMTCMSLMGNGSVESKQV